MSMANGSLDKAFYDVIEVHPLTCHIGAEIIDLDLGNLTPQQTQAIGAALVEHQVLFFRDQRLTHETHTALGKAFGDLADYNTAPAIAEYPAISPVHADAKSTFVAGEEWHSDLTCNPAPPLGSILYLHTVPPIGGDTVFASMFAAYDALSERMKAYLHGLTAVHDANHVYRAVLGKLDKEYPTSIHPVVRTHPVSKRKAIFVNPLYVTHICELSRPESDAILTFLYQHCVNPNFQVRFRWEARSVAFWDNRSTWHMAIWDYYPATRSGFRIAIEGDVPA